MSVPTTQQLTTSNFSLQLFNRNTKIMLNSDMFVILKKMLNLVIMYSYSIATVILLSQYLAVSGNLYDTIVYKSNTLSF